MNSYQSLFPQLEAMGLGRWSRQLQEIIPARLSTDAHGKMADWQEVLKTLPDLRPEHVELKSRVEVGCAEELGQLDVANFTELLKTFCPWRKGPINLFGVEVDTEWHSDWKWDRVLPNIQSLAGRRVLDVGSGNGYYGWRMLGEGAELVLGIDPTLISVMQYQVVQRYVGDSNHYVLPLGIEDVPGGLACFDTVFSMGVMYHRRSPLDHLLDLRTLLHPGGELVLETLIVEGDEGKVLMPEGRYAKMRNVWFLPSVPTIMLWLRRCGYKNIECVDVNCTSIDEQRQTEWMTFESLADFLDPQNPTKTIEGYPAPRRAIFIANAP